ncbi:pH regulation protein F [bacterium]|nr:pH regulation protein F [bacterium]
MMQAALILLLLSMALVLLRAIKGPSLPDRILSANGFGSNIVAFIAILAIGWDRVSFIDIALVYALINMILSVALLKGFEYERLDVEGNELYHPTNRDTA